MNHQVDHRFHILSVIAENGQGFHPAHTASCSPSHAECAAKLARIFLKPIPLGPKVVFEEGEVVDLSVHTITRSAIEHAMFALCALSKSYGKVENIQCLLEALEMWPSCIALPVMD